jgi:hypothetical protein
MYGQPLINWVTWIGLGVCLGLPLAVGLLVAPWAGVLDDIEGWKRPKRTFALLFALDLLATATVFAACTYLGASALETGIATIGTYGTIPVWIAIFVNPPAQLPRRYSS